MSAREAPFSLDSLTWRQRAALLAIRANHGEASEGTIGLEGFNPRLVMPSLARKGLVVRGEYLDETDGYVYREAE